MNDSTILSIDVGTHAARAIVFDSCGALLTQASHPLDLRRLGEGRVEQDPDELLAATRGAVDEVLAQVDEPPGCAGLAVQRSSVAFWDRESCEALAPVLSWQDTRAAHLLDPLLSDETDIARRTGLRLSPHYGASKLAWALSELPIVAKAEMDGRLAMGPLASWILAGLCGGEPRVDHANASRTLLWNLERRDWDPVLLERFGLPLAPLPELRPIRHDYGMLFETGIPVTAVNGDQNAALFAEGSLSPGGALVNLGTGAFILLPTGSEAPRHEALLCGIADSDEHTASYFLEGTVNGAGAALTWAEERWGLAALAPRLDDLLLSKVKSAIFLNAVGGLGSPWWRHDIDSRLVERENLLRGGSPRDSKAEAALAASVAESILFLVRTNLDVLSESGAPIHRLQVAGGLARSEELCRRLAALVDLPIEVSRQGEATARGIAWLAASRPRDWPSAEPARFLPIRDRALAGRYEAWLDMMRKLPQPDRA